MSSKVVVETVAARSDTDWVLGGTPVRLDRADGQLIGRERESAELDGGLRDPAGPRLVFIRGERGIGRSAFVHAAAGRLTAAGIAVLPVNCVPGDDEQPLMLAFRLVKALEEHRSAAAQRHHPRKPDAKALSAVQRGDRAAMAEALAAALAQPTPVTVVVDDAQHADADSLALLDQADLSRVPPGTRLLVTAVQHTGTDTADPSREPGDTSNLRSSVPLPVPGCAPEQPVPDPAVRTIILSRLSSESVTAWLEQRLRATPDADLVQQAQVLTRSLPGALDALLVAWVAQGAIGVVDRHAFLVTGAPVPTLPDGDRHVAALRALGEPCGTVAEALSVLWPLGRVAAALVVASTGLTAEVVDHGISALVDEGIMDDLHAPDGATSRGWTFRVPLLAHSVRERLSPFNRARLSAAAVDALWSAGAPGDDTAPPSVLAEADAVAYLPNRIADAGLLVDRKRAVAELTAAAGAVYPDHGRRGMVRWLLGAVRLIDEPSARQRAILRCGQAAFGCDDFRMARTAAERILNGPAEGLDALTLHEAATLLVASAAVEQDWQALSRMGTAEWWEGRRLPALATVSGRVQALLQLERWQESLTLLAQSEAVWKSTPGTRSLLELFSRVGEFVLGRPGRFRKDLVLAEVPGVPPNKAFAQNIAQFNVLLGIGDLREGKALLTVRAMKPESLPEPSRFLWHHLEGQWDEALTLARRNLVNGTVLTVAPGHLLLPARTAAILLARGRVTGAARLIDTVRSQLNGPLEHVLDQADAEVLRTLGELEAAEQVLRRGLRAADERGSVYGTDELWASLAAVHAQAGATERAAGCVAHLEQLAEQTDSSRTRLLYLLTSGTAVRPGSAEAGRHLCQAVGLARSRSQPFETAVTLLTAAPATEGPAKLLHEAYELFGETGAALWRFHTRTAMREARLVIPGREIATEENQQLLATLLAEGLTNRQIAQVLRLSQDAVANRLSRLFARTGMRSRTEVVTAVLTGSPLTGDNR
ncbi:AAA family ATPase [Streptomyces sp. NPDC005574]|uniref:AAA family ATPase n=1 Tax=Streptomyces sp. NPDC005574 TaxID=3156891 RepID=UPI0033B9EEA8